MFSNLVTLYIVKHCSKYDLSETLLTFHSVWIKSGLRPKHKLSGLIETWIQCSMSLTVWMQWDLGFFSINSVFIPLKYFWVAKEDPNPNITMIYNL